MLSVIKMNVDTLSVINPSAVVLTVTMQSIAIVHVFVLSDVILLC
jgi:hypothetical protein